MIAQYIVRGSSKFDFSCGIAMIKWSFSFNGFFYSLF
jgi:hypothetical protein